MRSYRAYYALKYVRKARCRALGGAASARGTGRRHALLACVAMALSSRMFRVPPMPRGTKRKRSTPLHISATCRADGRWRALSVMQGVG